MQPGKSIFSDLSVYGFLFLLPLWFILHANNAYFGLIPLSLSVAFLGKYLLIAIAFVALAMLLFRGRTVRGFIFSAVLFFSFFLFGPIQDQLRAIDTNLGSYRFILPGFLMFLTLLLLVLKRLKREPAKTSIFLKWLCVLFVVVEIVIVAVNLIGGKSEVNDISGDNAAIPASPCTIEKPDIFYIVFDEYPSSKSLQEDLGFNNEVIDSLLKASGFFAAPYSVSNYNVSPFSLSSVLDASYLQPRVEQKPDAKSFIQALETYEENRLVAFLHRAGYEIRNYGCFELEQAPLTTRHYFEDMYDKMIDGGTMWGRIEKDIWWQFRLRNVFTGKFRVPASYVEKRDYHIYRNEYNFSSLRSELQPQGKSKPRFVLAHLMLPHEPFYLLPDGRLRSDTAILRNTLSPMEGFLDQVKYANKLLKEIATLAGNKTGRERVIIVQGDHGYRFFEKPADSSKQFKNLNAIYFSDRNYSALSDSLSSVNTFRVVLNKYFCQQMPMLRDSCIFVPTELQ